MEVKTSQLFGFVLDGIKHALPVACVQRAIRAVAITPTTYASVGLLGLINLQGHILPVLDLRAILQLPARALSVDDYMVIFQNQERLWAIVVDEVYGIFELATEAGVGPLKQTQIDQQQDLVFLHDPDEFQCEWEAGHV